MTALLRGLGIAQPPHALDQPDLAAAAAPCSCATDRQRKLLPALYRRAAVERRHSVVVNTRNGHATLPVHDRMLAFYPPAADAEDRGPGLAERMRRYPEEALPLAADAARAALDDAGVPPDAVGQLVTVSCTGFSAPGVDLALLQTLGLPATTQRTLVGFMGCHGALNGLRVARALAADLPRDRHVLLVCVELCTLHFQYGWDPQKIVANALFADGAAAAVLSNSPTDREGLPALRPQHQASVVLPGSADAMTWLIRDHGFEMTLSPRVPDLVRQRLRPWLEPWLDSLGIPLDGVHGWAIHPGGPRVVTAVEEALGLPGDAGDPSRDVLRGCGNMSSPTVLFILDRLRRRAVPRPWVALAFGPGLTIEAAVFV
ncbi:MAG: type III polyketide synthase [Planctomycetota bacterium]